MRSKLHLLFFVILIGALSCKKETSESPTRDITINKVNAWLDNQIALTKSAKAQNILLLKENLDIANLKLENSEDNEQLVTIPIKESFKQSRNIASDAVPCFVAIMNKAGSIRKANVVLYIPKAGNVISALPDKTFYNILNEGANVVSGQFRFLSVAGRWLYQLDYNEKGNLSAFGLVQQKSKPVQNVANANDVTTFARTCTDWYLITTNYYSDGSTTTNEEYIGRTCEGSNDDIAYQSLNPDDWGGSATIDYVFAAKKPKEWSVSAYLNEGTTHWDVHSIEEFSVKQIASEPQGGHFTAISHQTIYVYIGSSSFLWETISTTVSLDNPRLGHAYIKGWIKGKPYVLPGFQEPVENEKEWRFNQVF